MPDNAAAGGDVTSDTLVLAIQLISALLVHCIENLKGGAVLRPPSQTDPDCLGSTVFPGSTGSRQSDTGFVGTFRSPSTPLILTYFFAWVKKDSVSSLKVSFPSLMLNRGL